MSKDCPYYDQNLTANNESVQDKVIHRMSRCKLPLDSPKELLQQASILTSTFFHQEGRGCPHICPALTVT